MKTDDLIGLLAADTAPVPRHAGERRFALALAAGALLALAWVAAAYGLRADLSRIVFMPVFWEKVAMPLAVAASGLVVVFRLAHPGARVRGWWIGAGLPVLLLWIWAVTVLIQADPAARADLLLGSTWRVCVFNVVATALPVGAGLFWALRGLAPTRPMLTGAMAGWLAGAVGACVYSLHCPEMDAPFLAVWYVLGMAASAGIGAWAGRRWLRW
ncbi:MAG: DUF1109 domain-containing protein [Mitsuaria chitosanitabida]|uniref:DUF1109 domain-containing protein n=1 Tax=Roseateles chitosanitabidus TaxID=65048 RepID=UPI001B1C91F9|nr:DUF1109 domain-containing protein [Roseateles chitosanitabidus]MBO9685313.1 DUF1109 domain-containing protein [Roseateles chitosanitabidus]